MRKLQLLEFAALLLVCCAMLGCEKQNVEPEPEIVTKIYGTVFDYETGNPLQGAQIQFGRYHESYYGHEFYRISSSVSGSDGFYELIFGELPQSSSYDIYQIRVDYSDWYTKIVSLDVVEGNSYRIDINY